MHTSDSFFSSGAARQRRQEYSHLLPAPIPAPEAQWALFLDVDGTLLDLAATPDAVKIPEGLIDLLGRLHQRLGGALALVSGRRIDTLDVLFRPLILPCAGLHGFERRDGVGHIYRARVDATALHAMRTAAQRLAEALPSVFMEDKIFSIAFHVRKAKQHEAMIRASVEAIAQNTGFVIQRGIDVYEIRPPGSDKGTAVQQLMRDDSFRHRLPIYIGDDITDENALFAAQKFAGIGIHVGTAIPSAARFVLTNPSSVIDWLYQWEEQLS